MLKFIFLFLTFQILGRLPLSVLYRMATLAADIAYLTFPRVRRDVRDNLRHALPPGAPEREMRRAARRVFRNVALYYADLAQLPYLDIEKFFRERLVFRGLHEHFLPALESGKGVIMLSAHIGNPELAVQGLVCLGVRVFALTEPLRPGALSRMLDRIRSSKGHTFRPVSVGNVKRVIQTLREGGAVALMGDRDIQGPKDSLPFLDAEALIPTGPIAVALRSGATVIPSFSSRDGYMIDAEMEEPLELERTGDFQEDMRTGTRLFLQRLERRLRTDPAQWAVLESIWERTGGEARKAVIAAIGGSD